MKKCALAVAAAVAVAAPVTTAISAGSAGSAEAAPATQAKGTVGYVVDGDTIRLDSGKYVRLIGYDTAEIDTNCGVRQAEALKQMIHPGYTVRLLRPASEPDTDRHGRLLRYVRTAGNRDVGTAMIRYHDAEARYDSTDGYAYHPLQEKYHRLDARYGHTCGHRHPSTPHGSTHGGGGSPTPAPVPATGGGSAAPVGYSCPPGYPIKGNQGDTEWIYHTPSSATYGITHPEECFATGAAALAAGYRPARD